MEERGLVGYLGLIGWFDALPENEKQIIRNSYKTGNHPKDIDTGHIIFSSETQTFFLHSIANRFYSEGLENRQIEILKEALTMSGTSQDKHFVYNQLIEYYKKEVNFKKAIYYCELDMDLINDNEDLQDFLLEGQIPSLDFMDSISEYKELIHLLNNIFKENESIIQKDLYKYPEFQDKKESLRSFLYWMSRGEHIIRTKKGNTYELKLKEPLENLF